MRITVTSKGWSRLREQIQRFTVNKRGVAAIEFAMLFPLMVMVCFGTIQASTGYSVDRKVSITVRSLSDLISQNATITDTQIANAFATGKAMMSPYSDAGLKSKISQIYVEPVTLQAKVKWSKASGTGAVAHTCNEVVSIPSALQVSGTYLILSEISYDFQPVVGHDIRLKIVPTFTMTDKMYTRPRQSLNVSYPTAPACA
jgi:Flp pilus assembly protein TadG